MNDRVDYSLTGQDLNRWGLPYARWGEISKKSPADLQRFLDLYGGIAILYEDEPHSGHWVLLTRRGPNHLEFLDSYGLRPDDELAYADYSRGQDHGRNLLRMALEAWKTVDYLGEPIQEWAPGVHTCGRYALARWLDRGPTLGGWLRKYGFRSGAQRENDLTVTALTSDLV